MDLLCTLKENVHNKYISYVIVHAYMFVTLVFVNFDNV